MASSGDEASGSEHALRQLATNHLSLGQFELGLALLRRLGAGGEALLRALGAEGPPAGWLPSPGAPSSAHMRWMAAAAAADIEGGAPGAARVAELALLLELVGRPDASEAGPTPPDVESRLGTPLGCSPWLERGEPGENEAGDLRVLLARLLWAPLASIGEGQLPRPPPPPLPARWAEATRSNADGWELVAAPRGQTNALAVDLSALGEAADALRRLAERQPALVAALVGAAGELADKAGGEWSQRTAALAAATEDGHLALLGRWLDRRDGGEGLEGAPALHCSACFRLAHLTGAGGTPRDRYGALFRRLLRGQTARARMQALQAALAIGSSELAGLMEECLREEEAQQELEVPAAMVACLRHWEGSMSPGATPPVPPPLLSFARARGIHVLQGALTSALSFVSEGDVGSAEKLLQSFPPLRPLLLAMSWDAPATPAWDVGTPGVALAARHAVARALWQEGVERNSEAPPGCCVSGMCRQIAYRLEVADLVEAHLQENPAAATGLPCAEGTPPEQVPQAAAALAVQLLAEQSPASVLGVFLQGASLQTLLEYAEKQPTDNAEEAARRQHDLRLLHTCLAVATLAQLLSLMALFDQLEDGRAGESAPTLDELQACVLAELAALQSHLGSVADGSASGYFARCWLLSVLRAALLMDGRPAGPALSAAAQCRPPAGGSAASTDAQRAALDEDGGLAAHCVRALLSALESPAVPSCHGNVPLDDDARRLVQEASGAHVAEATRFSIEAQWRLSLLRRMSPPGGAAAWRWADALALLQASPLTVLYMCKQRNDYELGREAVKHFDLPESEFSALKLAEWMDTTAITSQLDQMVSGLRRQEAEADGRSPKVATLDFSSLTVKLPEEQKAMLCIDVAVAVATSPATSERLLQHAKELLARVDSGPEDGSAAGRVSPQMRKAMASTLAAAQALAGARGRRRALNAEVAGVDEWRAGEVEASGSMSPGGSLGLGPWGKRMRALRLLAEAQAGIRYGRHQFLSGLLHNLAHALADDAGNSSSIHLLEACGFSGGLGAGSREGKAEGIFASPSMQVLQEASTMPVNYLASMISYLAQIGDELSSLNDDGAPTETHNYFALICESPKVLLPRLVIQDGCAEVAVRVATLMGTDVLHEILRACLSPVYPPDQQPSTSAPPSPEQGRASRGISPALFGSSTPAPGAFDLSLAVMRPLAVQSTIRAALASVFWLLQNPGHLSRHDGDEPGEGDDIAAFALEASELHRPLRRWIAHQLQDARRSSAPLAQEPNDEAPGGAAPDDYFALVPPECHDLMEGGHYAEALAAVDASGSYGPPPDAMLEDIVLGLLFGARVPSPRPSPARPGFGSFTTSRGDVSRDDAALSWQCVMRTADKARTAALIWRFMLHWELQEALDAALLCAAGLRAQGNPGGPAGTSKMEALASQLQLYSRILATDVGAEFASWQTLHTSFQDKRGQVIRRLVASGAPQLAVDMVEHVSDAADPLTPAVAYQAHAALVEALLGESGRHMAALKHLASLRPEDMFEAALRVLRARVPLPQANLLLQFLTQPTRLASFSSTARVEVERIRRGAAALQLLQAEPGLANWASQLHHLLPYPELLLEALIMSQQVNAAKAVLQRIPELHDDEVVAKYAELAVAIEVPDLSVEAASAAPRRSSTGNASSAPHTGDAVSRRYAVNVLSGNREYDNQLRAGHVFRAAPCPALFASVVDLASSAAAAAGMCAAIAERLLARLFSEDSPAPNAGEWCAALISGKLWAVAVGLQAADVAGAILATAQEKLQTASPEEGAANGLVGKVEEIQRQVELLQTLLGQGAGCVLEELGSPARSEALLGRLVAAERYWLAVYAAKRLRFSVPTYWETWGFALLRVGEYQEAENKFQNALRQLLGSHAAAAEDRPLSAVGGQGAGQRQAEARDLVLRVVHEVEHGAPADIAAVRAHVQAMLNSAMADDDKPLDEASFLTILKLPTQAAAPRSAPGARSPDPWAAGAKLSMAAVLLTRHAPDELLPFLFRHGRLAAACEHVVASPPYCQERLPASIQSTGQSKLHQLCQLSVDYVQVPEMVEALSGAGERGAAALAHAAAWMEAHRHPHHLYSCQLALGRPLAAGMTACLLFGMATTLDQGLQHLEHATGHFKEALGQQEQGAAAARAARQRGGEEAVPSHAHPHPHPHVHSHGRIDPATASQSDVARQLVLTGLQIDVVNAFKEQELQAQVGRFWTGEPVGEVQRTPREINLFLVPGERMVLPEGQRLEEEASAALRRERVAEALLEIDFSLAFRLMHDLRLPFEKVYSKVANRLAREHQHDWLRQLLSNLRTTISERAESEVVMAAVAGYASVGCVREGERLVKRLPTTGAKVAGLLRLRLLQKAFQMARSEPGNRAAMSMVLEEAKAQEDLGMVASAAAALGSHR